MLGCDAVQAYVSAASFIPMMMANGMIIIMCMSNITCLAEEIVASTKYFANKSWVGFS